jgi:hypothetical protein
VIAAMQKDAKHVTDWIKAFVKIGPRDSETKTPVPTDGPIVLKT